MISFTEKASAELKIVQEIITKDTYNFIYAYGLSDQIICAQNDIIKVPPK